MGRLVGLGRGKSEAGSVRKILPWLSTCGMGLAWEVWLKGGRRARQTVTLKGRAMGRAEQPLYSPLPLCPRLLR